MEGEAVEKLERCDELGGLGMSVEDPHAGLK